MPHRTERRSRPVWLVIAVLSGTGIVTSFQNTLLIPLLADFPSILHASVADSSWLVTATLVSGAVATPLLSKLADMYGKRLMVLICLGGVLVGSLLALFTDSLVLLIVARALAGIGAAVIPIGISMMRDELPADQLGFGVGLMSTTLGIGTALGLPLGGVLYKLFGWHSIFVVSALIAVLFMVLVALVIDESPVRTGGRFDLPGALLLSAALTALLLGISKGAEWGWTSAATLGSGATALLVGVGWLLLERRVSNPIVDIGTSLARPVLLTNVATLLLGFAMFCNMITTTQELQVPSELGGPGLDAFSAGLMMLPVGIAIILISPLSGILVQRLGGRVTLIMGAWGIVAGYLVRIWVDATAWQIVLGAIIVQAGIALMFGATPAVIMRNVPITETASANGVNALVRAIGTAVSSATVAAVFQMTRIETSGGAPFPAAWGFDIVFVLALVCAAAAAIIAIWIPRESRNELVTLAADELVIEGSVRTVGGKPVADTIIRVLAQGAVVDWGRSDAAGRFTVAVPEPGDYEAVVEPEGRDAVSLPVTIEADQLLELILD